MIFFWNLINFLRSESNIASFWICVDATFFGISRF